MRAHDNPPGMPAGRTNLARRSLIILLLIFAVNHVDRQLMAILIQPIKLELGLSDGAAGLLYGLAFTIFYSTLGIPIGWLSDRFNRVRIITTSLLLFSAMTAACGFATTYIQLLLARIAVGVGEAGTNPPSHSIIAELFPPERRTTAMSMFAVGPHLGIVLAFLAGGALGQYVGWRATFWIAGAAGVVLAIVARFMLKEPTRTMLEPDTARPDVRSTLLMLWRHPVLRNAIVGGTVANVALAALIAWLPSLLIRQHGMSMSATGAWLAFTIGALGGVGVLLGGWLADRLGARNNIWRLRTSAVGLFVSAPLWAVAIVSNNTVTALIAIAAASCLITIQIGPTFAIVQTLSPRNSGGLAAALLLFFANLIGVGIGPLAVGLLSDAFVVSHGVRSLSFGLLIVPPLWLWAAVHFELAGRELTSPPATQPLEPEATPSRSYAS